MVLNTPHSSPPKPNRRALQSRTRESRHAEGTRSHCLELLAARAPAPHTPAVGVVGAVGCWSPSWGLARAARACLSEAAHQLSFPSPRREKRLLQWATFRPEFPSLTSLGCLTELGSPFNQGAARPQVSSLSTGRAAAFLPAPQSRHTESARRPARCNCPGLGLCGFVAANPPPLPHAWDFPGAPGHSCRGSLQAPRLRSLPTF